MSPSEHVYAALKLLNATMADAQSDREQKDTKSGQNKSWSAKWLPEQRHAVCLTALQSNQSTSHFIKENLIASSDSHANTRQGYYCFVSPLDNQIPAAQFYLKFISVKVLNTWDTWSLVSPCFIHDTSHISIRIQMFGFLDVWIPIF